MFKILFIGIGNMGFPMACNLLRGGHHLNVYDILTQRADLLPFRAIEEND